MKFLRKITPAGLLIGLMTLSPALAPRLQAQEPPPVDSAREALEALLIVTIKRELGMGTVEAVELAERSKGILEIRRARQKEVRKLQKSLRELAESPETSAEAVDDAISDYFDLRKGLLDEEQKMFAEAAKDLEPAQRVKLFIALDRFEGKVRRHLEKFRGRDDGPRKGRRSKRRRGSDY